MTAVADVENAPPAGGRAAGWRWRFGRRPPGWLFHASLVVPTLLVLWAASYPGLDVVPAVIGGGAMAVAGVVWCARLVGYLGERRQGRATASARWFVVAPVAALVVVVLLVEHAPLRVRWAASRAAFEEVVRQGDGGSSPLPADIGWYRVTQVVRHGDAVIFYEDHEGILDGTGFAYLPGGPDPGLPLVRPRFIHLTGDWYSWTASW